MISLCVNVCVFCLYVFLVLFRFSSSVSLVLFQFVCFDLSYFILLYFLDDSLFSNKRQKGMDPNGREKGRHWEEFGERKL